MFLCLALAPSADAYIFWSSYNSGNSTVGRADLDGGNVLPNLISGIYFGQGVATDGTYVYWGQSGNGATAHGAIGRANVDGSNPNPGFEDGGTYCGIFDIVSTSTDLYWLKNDCSGLSINTRIDKAPIAGGNYSEPGAGSYVCGFDVDANYVYWSEGHYIARAPNVNPPVPPDKTWLDVGASTGPCAVAVDAGHVYWTTTAGAPTYRGGSIGRASIDGDESTVENNFITGTSFTNAAGIDVAGGFIYWTNQAAFDAGNVTGAIGRADVSGGSVNQSFIPNLFNPNSIDVGTTGGAGGGGAAPGGSTPPGGAPLGGAGSSKKGAPSAKKKKKHHKCKRKHGKKRKCAKGGKSKGAGKP